MLYGPRVYKKGQQPVYLKHTTLGANAGPCTQIIVHWTIELSCFNTKLIIVFWVPPLSNMHLYAEGAMDVTIESPHTKSYSVHLGYLSFSKRHGTETNIGHSQSRVSYEIIPNLPNRLHCLIGLY